MSDIIEMDKTLAEFDGWSLGTVGYYGQRDGEIDDETDWQVENRAWLDQMEIESVGRYWVKIAENKYYEYHDLRYHKDWNLIMPVWVKFRDLRFDNESAEKGHSEWCGSLSWYLYSSNEPARFCERLYYAITWYNSLKRVEK